MDVECAVTTLLLFIRHGTLLFVVITLYVRQIFLILVHFAAVDGEGQAFEQHGPLLQLSVSVGEQTQGTALGNSNSG